MTSQARRRRRTRRLLIAGRLGPWAEPRPIVLTRYVPEYRTTDQDSGAPVEVDRG